MPFLLVEIRRISVTKNTCVDPAAGAKKGCCRKEAVAQQNRVEAQCALLLSY